MIIKRTVEGKTYEIDTEDAELVCQMDMSLIELATDLMDSYDGDTIAYGAGASLFVKIFGK